MTAWEGSWRRLRRSRARPSLVSLSSVYITFIIEHEIMVSRSAPASVNQPVLALDDQKPIELIARGEYKQVARLIAEIEYPGVS